MLLESLRRVHISSSIFKCLYVFQEPLHFFSCFYHFFRSLHISPYAFRKLINLKIICTNRWRIRMIANDAERFPCNVNSITSQFRLEKRFERVEGRAAFAFEIQNLVIQISTRSVLVAFFCATNLVRRSPYCSFFGCFPDGFRNRIRVGFDRCTNGCKSA